MGHAGVISPATGRSMHLSQTQKTQAKLSMTTLMRTSLALLQLGPEDLGALARDEVRRNPFLRPVPASAAPGAALPDAADTAGPTSHAADLLHQIGLIALPADQQHVARALPYCLDERGFLADPAEEISAYLQTTPATLRAVVARVQAAVEPAGLFAWSLADCLRLQLEARNRYDPLIARVLTRLDLVARQDIPAICALCEVDAEDAQDMIADIRALNPAPLGRAELPPPPAPLPELILRADPDDTVRARLNADALPRLLADDGLFDRLSAVPMDAAARTYYRDCYRGAAGFVTAMQKRANTLLRIGQIIADRQGRFIRSGRPQDRQPLTMGAIADHLGLNKSTVSRALSNCRVETDLGVLAAAEFLARPLSDANAERTRDQALQRLSLLIRTEDPREPHLDQTLTTLLARAGLHLSRRTVTKYRGLLGLPGAPQRRRPPRQAASAFTHSPLI